MRTRFFALSLCALALSGAAFARDTSSDLRKYVQANMNGFIVAFKKKDMNAIETMMRGFFAKNFTATGMDGKKMNLDQMIAQERQHVASLKKIGMISLKLGAVKASGNKGSAMESFKMTAEISNPQSPKKVSHLRVDSQAMSMYEKMGGKWMCTASKSIKEKVWVDGKLMPPGM